jgi:hypothetical protein
MSTVALSSTVTTLNHDVWGQQDQLVKDLRPPCIGFETASDDNTNLSEAPRFFNYTLPDNRGTPGASSSSNTPSTRRLGIPARQTLRSSRSRAHDLRKSGLMVAA